MEKITFKQAVAVMLLFSIAMLALTGCGAYRLANNTITTTTQTDGTVVVEEKICEVSIDSIREIKGGDIQVSKSCALTGGADSMGANEDMIKLLKTLIMRGPG